MVSTRIPSGSIETIEMTNRVEALFREGTEAKCIASPPFLAYGEVGLKYIHDSRLLVVSLFVV